MTDAERLLKAKIPCSETGIEVKKSMCTICDPQTQCGLDVFVKDGKIVKVEGNEDHPYNGGVLCSKGAATRQYVYSEDRIKTPLKRVGPRGSGQFEPISWAEALDTIAEKCNAAKAEYGPESVAFFAGYTKYFRPYLTRLAMSFGSPNYATESSTCFFATAMAMMLVYGRPGAADIANTDCLLTWSSNPFYTNPGNARMLLKRKKEGMKIICVDPRRSPTAGFADIHLPVRPGTDGALALAMANVIISENLHDKDFIREYTVGFEEYRAYVAGFTPERGETLTGVPAARIREAARLFAKSGKSAIMFSASPVVHHTNGVQNYRAVFMLSGLTGNYDVKGGNFVQPMSFIHMPGRFYSREAEFENRSARAKMAPAIGSGNFPVWNKLVPEAQIMYLPEQLRTGKPYKVRCLLGFGPNYRMWPDSDGMLASLENLDFFAATDVFMTDTCQQADIVLPACTSLERSEFRCYGMGYAIWTQPAIAPLYDSRSDVDIIFELAKRMCPEDELFAMGYEKCVDWILEPSGLTVEEMKKHPGGMFVPDPLDLPERKYMDGGFGTPSGKMEFVSKILEPYEGAPGLASLPVYTPPKYSPEGSPEIYKDYPLILNTGSRLPMFVHTRTYRLSWTSSLRPGHPLADINPADAKKYGIEQGGRIRISTPKGCIEVGANLTEMVRPGVVHMYHGHMEADANKLLEWDYLDPISGFPGFKSALCKIENI